MTGESLPQLPPLSEWEATRLQWQLMCQIVGKVRLQLHPTMNHWWHVPLYVSARGLTTGAIPYGDRCFDVELDLIDHRVVIRSSDGAAGSFDIKAEPIARFYAQFFRQLSNLQIQVSIDANPFKCNSNIPFAQDEEHATYDPSMVTEAWKVLVQSDRVFKEFRSRYLGKCSPVHMFWHSFDLAVTRFSGRKAPEILGADHVTQEAYSHEVCSAGFWFGDGETPEAAYYCYTFPSPSGLDSQPLAPGSAFWKQVRGAPMALLALSDLRREKDPEAALLDFLQTSYEAGASCSNWDRASLEIS